MRWSYLWTLLADVLERGADQVAGDDEPLYCALVQAAIDCRRVATATDTDR